MNSNAKKFYKIINPYQSNIVHASSTLIGGANKCYRELKQTLGSGTDFSIMDVYSNDIYKFEKNHKLHGGMPNVLPSGDIISLNQKISSLEKRIISLEDKLNLSHPTQMSKELPRESLPSTNLTLEPINNINQPSINQHNVAEEQNIAVIQKLLHQ